MTNEVAFFKQHSAIKNTLVKHPTLWQLDQQCKLSSSLSVQSRIKQHILLLLILKLTSYRDRRKYKLEANHLKFIFSSLVILGKLAKLISQTQTLMDIFWRHKVYSNFCAWLFKVWHMVIRATETIKWFEKVDKMCREIFYLEIPDLMWASCRNKYCLPKFLFKSPWFYT